MHNALAVLMALAAWRVHRLLGVAMTLFAVLIYIGSILLAWHYAADGMAGILIGLASWHLAGWITRRLDARPQTRRYCALLRAVGHL
jgi:membrane-associated phospholipid phosphatase